MRLGFAVMASAAIVAGCRDARKDAVDEVISFSQAAPFSIGSPSRRFSGYRIVVADSALGEYNRIFRYFDPHDSSRAHAYRELPGVLFWSLPVTRAKDVFVRQSDGDTLVATVVVERPEQRLFQERFRFVLEADSLPPTQSAIDEFRHALARVRNELQEPDTLVFRVVSGPYIVSIRTASGVRDSVVRDSLARFAHQRLERLVNEAKFANLEMSDYANLRSYAGLGGGAIKGDVRPGASGWFKDARVLTDIRVQCEARRGDQSTAGDAWVNAEEGTVTGTRDFLCSWHGDQAREWDRIRPIEFRVRLMGAGGFDSVFGPWVSVRR